MSWFLNAAGYDLAKIAARIRNADLTPGVAPIKAALEENIRKIGKAGYTVLSEIRPRIRTKDKALKFAAEVGIESEYMLLLRRELEGWFKEKISIDGLAWIDRTIVDRLKTIGIGTFDEVYDRWNSKKTREELQSLFRDKKSEFERLYRVVDLARIRWVSPVVARILVEIGYDTVDKIRNADADELSRRFDECNKMEGYFKGKIGARDIKRLIDEAKYAE